MEYAKLTLTSKDSNRNPLGKLDFELRYVTRIQQISQYHFVFAPPVGNKLEFNLDESECVAFFGLLDTVFTPHLPPPSPLHLTTVDDKGVANGAIDITAKDVKQFSDLINLYSFEFTQAGYGTLDFYLTSTDASSIFSVFDGILWSNPPTLLTSIMGI